MSARPDATASRRRMIDKVAKLAKSVSRDNPVARVDPRVLEVMAVVPRHAFVPRAGPAGAYINAPLDIGHGQTISQPFIVALMTSLARVGPRDRVLEVGTGSGYQTAILAALAEHVYSVETVAALAERALDLLHEQDIINVTTTVGDGSSGWSDHAPYDAIVVTAAPADVPPALVDQLAPGGRLVIPVGSEHQILTLIEKSAAGGLRREPIIAVRFVPLITS